jgi:hypothetical protein
MNTRGRPSNVSKGLPETGLLAVRVPKDQIAFIRELAAKEGLRPGELVTEIIASVIEGIDNA